MMVHFDDQCGQPNEPSTAIKTAAEEHIYSFELQVYIYLFLF